ncbi:hypothetical protein BDQ12DRAFT_668826 [Crucibulum laeve]|uniref:Uncharacterized protein n=1 Tax=Crucibulum laeve TaxID=68775 RepID=A0A5C3LSV1_9AGAR|nr:hypothetical protein BDQ12DRAFT_668826 [Crucibulum laeve]
MDSPFYSSKSTKDDSSLLNSDAHDTQLYYIWNLNVMSVIINLDKLVFLSSVWQESGIIGAQVTAITDSHFNDIGGNYTVNETRAGVIAGSFEGGDTFNGTISQATVGGRANNNSLETGPKDETKLLMSTSTQMQIGGPQLREIASSISTLNSQLMVRMIELMELLEDEATKNLYPQLKFELQTVLKSMK